MRVGSDFRPRTVLPPRTALRVLGFISRSVSNRRVRDPHVVSDTGYAPPSYCKILVPILLKKTKFLVSLLEDNDQIIHGPRSLYKERLKKFIILSKMRIL